MTENTPKFYIEKSLLNKSWEISSYDEKYVADVVQTFDIPEIIARILFTNKIKKEKIPGFLNPKIKNELPEPLDFKDMKKGIERVKTAVKNNETIGIFGDYDVDGATSTALFIKFLKDIKHDKFLYHIPDREKEGYGPNKDAILKLKEKGASLIITVDCGITAFDVIDPISEQVDIIVIDHHEAETKLPKAIAVIDPKRIDENTEHTYFAAVGVVYLFLLALNRELRASKYYKEKDISEPNLLSYLDLVAFGTVCDVVPLIKANRAYVTTGLKILQKRENIGLKKLCDIAGVNKKPEPYHLGFLLGPRINAGGRVGDSMLGTKLLSTDDEIIAEKIAEKLNNFNQERKDIENFVLINAIEQIEKKEAPEHFVFTAGKGWHTGVIGIIAGRIKEQYNLPTLIATIDEDGLANGSARSVSGIDIGRAIILAKEKNILIEGGGHSMAAGFTCHIDKIAEFKNFIKEDIIKQTNGKGIKQILKIAGVLSLSAVNHNFIKKLKILEPFGTDNEEPVFIFSDAKLSYVEKIKNNHIKCSFKSMNGKNIRAMAFKSANTALGEAFLKNKGSSFQLAAKIKENNYNGRNYISLNIIDAVKA